MILLAENATSDSAAKALTGFLEVSKIKNVYGTVGISLSEGKPGRTSEERFFGQVGEDISEKVPNGIHCSDSDGDARTCVPSDGFPVNANSTRFSVDAEVDTNVVLPHLFNAFDADPMTDNQNGADAQRQRITVLRPHGGGTMWFLETGHANG